MPPLLLNAKQVGELLDCSYSDVLAWAKRGLIPSIQCRGRYYFREDRVLKALNERAIAKQAEAATVGAGA